MDKSEVMDMLRGNLNRMCVTHDRNELESMYKWAQARLNMLYELRLKDLPVEQKGE